MKKRGFKIVVWKEGKYYVAQCLDVDVSSFGKSRPEAVANLQDALELYFKDEPIPSKSQVKNPIIASVTLEHA